MDIFISMATKLTIKTILKLIIVFFLTFNNVSASTISGYELENLIEDWLKKKESSQILVSYTILNTLNVKIQKF